MSEQPTEPRLRVNKLTLFSHGVASLELSAQVQGDAVLHLSFSERHMNDVLKSLTVVDTSGGQIASISYEAPSKSRRDDDENFPLSADAALFDLLQNAQGAAVTVLLNDGRRVTGSVLGTEWLPVIQHAAASSERRRTQSLHLVLLTDGSLVVKHDIATITAIQLLDDILQTQLARRLRASLTSLRAKNNKLVTISTKGTGQRTILANYAVESPVYKLTYRFLLGPRKLEQTRPDSVFVQGWAIIDNPCDEDLDNIDVTIVSGLPISFRHDLYGARFVERPEEKIPTASGPGYTQPSQATILHKIPRKQLALKAGRRERKRGGLFGMSSSQSEQEPEEMSPAEDDDVSAAFADVPETSSFPPLRPPPSAEASEIGDLFEYNLPSKVMLKARESALVPLIMRECEGGSIDIYSHKVRPTNTLSAVRIKNTTDATLEGGPVSVYERSRLVGEGMMKACMPGSEQFLPYSVDLDCIAEMTRDCESGEILSTVIFGGYIHATRHREFIRRYVFRNNKTDDIELYVLHALEANSTLDVAAVKTTRLPGEAQSSTGSDTEVEIQVKPTEVDSSTARYRITIPPAHSSTLRVTEKTHHLTSYKITNHCTEDAILMLSRDGVISEETAEKMHEISKLQVDLSSVQGEITECRAKIQELNASQERFRKNLESLGGLHESSRFKDNPLIEKYIRALSESEEKIEARGIQLQAGEDQRRKLESTRLAKLQAFEEGKLG